MAKLHEDAPKPAWVGSRANEPNEYGGTPAFTFAGYTVKGANKYHAQSAFNDAHRDPDGVLAKLKSGRWAAMGRPYRISRAAVQEDHTSDWVKDMNGHRPRTGAVPQTACVNCHRNIASYLRVPDVCPYCSAKQPFAESFTMTDVKIPLCEIGPAGRTRMSVQNYYDNQRNLGISVRDAVRGTEFALNIRNVQTDASGKTIVYFDEGVKYHTCPECEANFPETSLKDGKLPPHKFNGKSCPGTVSESAVEPFPYKVVSMWSGKVITAWATEKEAKAAADDYFRRTGKGCSVQHDGKGIYLRESTGYDCEMFEYKPNQWYYALATRAEPYDDDWVVSGPFRDVEAAWKHLHDNHANPGGASEIPHASVKQHPKRFDAWMKKAQKPSTHNPFGSYRNRW